MDVIVSPPPTIDLSEPSDREFKHIAELFDAELMEDVDHSKRFQHFNERLWPAFESVFSTEHFHNKPPRLWFLIAFASALILLWAYSQQGKLETPGLLIPKTIDITLAPPQPTVAEPEMPQVERRGEVLDAKNKNAVSEPAPTDGEAKSEQPKANPTTPRPTDWPLMIEQLIAERTRERQADTPSLEDSITARGTVFNPALREKLHSRRHQFLNRWRPPGEKLDTVSAEKSYMVLGDKCYVTREDVSNPLSYAMGDNPGFLEHITTQTDCKNVYYSGRITRDNVHRTSDGRH